MFFLVQDWRNLVGQSGSGGGWGERFRVRSSDKVRVLHTRIRRVRNCRGTTWGPKPGGDVGETSSSQLGAKKRRRKQSWQIPPSNTPLRIKRQHVDTEKHQGFHVVFGLVTPINIETLLWNSRQTLLPHVLQRHQTDTYIHPGFIYGGV